MSLLKEIIKDATTGDDVARLLRKCMVLAHILRSGELASWTKAELNGYAADAELPTYRHLSCRSQGQMVGPFNAWQGTFEIPLSVLPERMRSGYGSVEARAPIAHFENLVGKSDGTGRLMQPWPTDVARHFAPKAFIEGTQCLKAWNEISSSEVEAMLDQVKSRVLEFALQISTEFPELGQGDDLLNNSAAKEAQVNQTFNTTIMGSVGNYASGSTNVTQSNEPPLTPGDYDALSKALVHQGLSAEQIAALKQAIDADKAYGEDGMGSRVKAWLGNLTALAVTGTGAVGVNAIGGAIAPLIAKFLGLS